MCSVAILNLPLSRNLALPLPLPSSQVLPVLHLTLLWPGPGWLSSMSLETQHQLSVLKLMLSNLPTPSCYRHLQISWPFLLFHWMFLEPWLTDVLFNPFPIIHIGHFNIQSPTLQYPGNSVPWAYIFQRLCLLMLPFLRHSLPWSHPKPCYYK